MDNLSYLFWAHVIFWILLFLYILHLVEKNKKLQKELEALKNSINKTKEEKLTWQKQGVN
ncbi:MAG TPA: CcmD family protein [Thermodesulfobacteriota bacterium]|nr:CcmD family protein [Thermodesulfobacteriota bacterium]